HMLSNAQIPIKSIHYLDLHESMANGGGPACLRLRIVLTESELKSINPHVILSDFLYEKLVQWIEKHFRETLNPKDLADPDLLKESRQALDELTQILRIGSVYSFQF